MPQEYETIRLIEADNGVFARITRRQMPSGIARYSCAFFRRYPKGNEEKETAWFSDHHLSELDKLIPQVRACIAAEEAHDR